MEILKNKAVWITAAIFGLVKGVIWSLTRGALDGIIMGLLWAAFGVVIAVAVIKLIQKQSSPNETKFTAALTLSLPFTEAFDLCKRSLGVLRKQKILKSDSLAGVLVAKLPMTLDSWGEVITFQIKDINGKSSVSINSALSMPNVLYNYDNSKKIIEYLQSYSSNLTDIIKNHENKPQQQNQPDWQ